MKFLALVLALATLPAAATAQSVGECGDWLASAQAIAEPWEDYTRTFANGNVRLAVIDAIEPGAAAFHLLVLTPPYDELGARVCAVVSYDAGFGFYAMHFENLAASYDPARGLTFAIPVEIWIDTYSVVRGLITTVNQATGEVRAELVSE